jgi:hypothetical protein
VVARLSCLPAICTYQVTSHGSITAKAISTAKNIVVSIIESLIRLIFFIARPPDYDIILYFLKFVNGK